MQRLAFAVLATAALVVAAGAGATTGVEQTVPVKVTLTDRGVRFSHRLRLDTDTTLDVLVVNGSSSSRWFSLGWRKTHALQRGGSEEFFYSFHVPGSVAWRSGAAGRRTFRGTFVVRLAPGGG